MVEIGNVRVGVPERCVPVEVVVPDALLDVGVRVDVAAVVVRELVVVIRRLVVVLVEVVGAEDSRHPEERQC